MYILEVALLWTVFLVFIQSLLWVLYVRNEEPLHPATRFIAGRQTQADLPTVTPEV
jgi:hypothetical protein